MKTITRILTIATFLILTVNVNANSGANAKIQTDLLFDEIMESSLVSSVFEEELVIENWMTEPKTWGNFNEVEKIEEEENLQMENWMTDLNSYSNNEDDESLQLQAWMFNF